jgi:hypothetical protein
MIQGGEESNTASPIELNFSFFCQQLPKRGSGVIICNYHLGILQITMRHTWSVSATKELNNEIFGSTLCKTSFGIY